MVMNNECTTTHVSGGAPGLGAGRLLERVRARLGAAALDRELARGIAPDSRPALELRARALSRPRVRRELGEQLRHIVGQAHQPPGPGTRIRARRAGVLASEDELRLLASRLYSSRRVAVAGIAKVRVLLTDGSGPLYYRHSEEDLEAAIREATLALS
jgi:hypothetical protein